MENKKIPTLVYTEQTPNPAAMKFVADRMLITGPAIEFTGKAQAKASPLAMELFNFPFVTGVFLSSNFVTVNKNKLVEWEDILMDMRNFISAFLNSNEHVLSETVVTEKAAIVDNSKISGETISPEIDIKIANVLEEYIRPAVEQDGGAIAFKSFKNGVVTVQLQGSCSGCPSSTVTLKQGIEGLLMRLVPEVTEVIAEAV
jgi:Fe-S cluster biogenesis protein NfuA